jgi:hypothetical protein
MPKTACKVVGFYKRCYLKTLLFLGFFLSLMMEAVITCETLVNFYQTTRRNIPDASHLLILRLFIDAVIDLVLSFYALENGK